MKRLPFFNEPDTTPDTSDTGTPADKKTSSKTSSSSDLLNVAACDIHYFMSPMDEPFASVTIREHKETIRVNSREFRQYLRMLYHLKHGTQVSKQTIEEVIELLEAQTRYNGITEPVYLRVAGHDNTIFIDTCNKNRDIIEITADSWRIIHNPPVHFIRKKSMDALPVPERNGDINSLRPFLNVPSDDSFLLYVSWLLRSLSATGPYPLLTLMGGPGSAKSTLLLVSRLLIDPSVSPNRSIPKNDRDLFIAASNNWCIAFDNLSFCPKWLSNALCTIATGGGYSTRKLYTDDEESIFKVKRPIIISGIRNLAKENDLIDRSIILSLPKIDESSRMPEDIFWKDFAAKQPGILGALCDIVSIILRNLPIVKTRGLPRMADFARWILAAESVLPPSTKGFLDIYKENQNVLIEDALSTDLIAQAVLSLMRNTNEWKGTATEALSDLGKQPFITNQVKNSPSWPKAANKLRERLQNVEPFLQNHDITIQFDIKEDMGTKKLKFIKAPQTPIPDWEIEAMSHEEEYLKDQETDRYNPYLYVNGVETDAEQNSTAPELDEAELYQSVF